MPFCQAVISFYAEGQHRGFISGCWAESTVREERILELRRDLSKRRREGDGWQSLSLGDTDEGELVLLQLINT